MIISFTIITLALIALSCILAVKFHKADKDNGRLSEAAGKLEPITLESISAVLKSKGCTIDNMDEKEQRIAFSFKDLRYYAEIGRKPLIILHTGFSVDENDDMECLSRAMLKTCEDFVMVKGNVYEDGYSFNIVSCEQYIGSFALNFDRYMDIFSDAIRRIGERYHEYLGEKRAKEQALDELQLNGESADFTKRDNKILS